MVTTMPNKEDIISRKLKSIEYVIRLLEEEKSMLESELVDCQEYR